MLEAVDTPVQTGEPQGVEQVRVWERVCGPAQAPDHGDQAVQPLQLAATGQQRKLLSRLDPEQKTPPHEVVGLEQVRVRWRLPQVISQSVQVVQPPLTARKAVRELVSTESPAQVLP